MTIEVIYSVLYGISLIMTDNPLHMWITTDDVPPTLWMSARRQSLPVVYGPYTLC